MGGGVDPRPGVVIFLVSAAVEERAVSLEPVFHACQQSTIFQRIGQDSSASAHPILYKAAKCLIIEP